MSEREFEMTHLFSGTTKTFTETKAPEWLRFGGTKESTMDNRWFWNDYVMTLDVGQSIETDFQRIKRIK
jgi:hypothetical protein